MTRREILASFVAAGAASARAQTASTPKSAFYELRYYRLRTDRADQTKRTIAYLTGTYLPAVHRAGAGPVGVFNSVIAPSSPFLLCLTSYASLAAMESVREGLTTDAAYQKGLAEYNSGADPGFMRMESCLLRAFDFFPSIVVAPADQKRSGRIFELRTYESLNETMLRTKIKMFGSGEIGIFRRCGLDPIFFGEAIVGANQPQLTYMVAFDNQAAREKAWAAFQADAEWQKLRSVPEFAAPGVVINISNSLVGTVAGSEVT